VLSKEAVLRYQKMTWTERFQIGEQLTAMALEQLGSLPQEEADRRWAVIRRDNERGRERILRHLERLDR